MTREEILKVCNSYWKECERRIRIRDNPNVIFHGLSKEEKEVVDSFAGKEQKK